MIFCPSVTCLHCKERSYSVKFVIVSAFMDAAEKASCWLTYFLCIQSKFFHFMFLVFHASMMSTANPFLLLPSDASQYHSQPICSQASFFENNLWNLFVVSHEYFLSLILTLKFLQYRLTVWEPSKNVNSERSHFKKIFVLRSDRLIFELFNDAFSAT
jgi:predicted small integral membrane protein